MNKNQQRKWPKMKKSKQQKNGQRKNKIKNWPKNGHKLIKNTKSQKKK